MMGWSAPDKGASRHWPSRQGKFQHPDVGWRPPIASYSRWRTTPPTYGIYGKPISPKPGKSRELLSGFRRAPATKSTHRARPEAPWHSRTWNPRETSGRSRSIWIGESQRERRYGLPKPSPDETPPLFPGMDTMLHLPRASQ